MCDDVMRERERERGEIIPKWILWKYDQDLERNFLTREIHAGEINDS